MKTITIIKDYKLTRPDRADKTVQIGRVITMEDELANKVIKSGCARLSTKGEVQQRTSKLKKTVEKQDR